MIIDTGTINEIARRIDNIYGKDPRIATMKDPWDLFKVDEFNIDDLENVSSSMAYTALCRVQEFRRGERKSYEM